MQQKPTLSGLPDARYAKYPEDAKAALPAPFRRTRKPSSQPELAFSQEFMWRRDMRHLLMRFYHPLVAFCNNSSAIVSWELVVNFDKIYSPIS